MKKIFAALCICVFLLAITAFKVNEINSRQSAKDESAERVRQLQINREKELDAIIAKADEEYLQNKQQAEKAKAVAEKEFIAKRKQAGATYDKAATECSEQLYDKSQDVHLCVQNRLKLSDEKYVALLVLANR